MSKGYLKVVESVPVQFVRRGGDWVQEGGNNTLVVLGTDRAILNGPATIDDGLGTVDAEGGGKGAGTVIMVAGRHDLAGGNPDINADDTTLYLSQLTDVDKNLGTVFESQNKGPSAVLVSDFVRLVFRQNMKIASALSATHAFLDGDHLHIDMQGKATVKLDVAGDSSTAEISVQNNTIKITSDGTVTVTSKNKVTVNAEAVTINSPVTTIMQKLHVGGDVDFAGALNVSGDVKSAGDVQSAGGAASLNNHTHIVPLVKAGPDQASTMTIASSTAKVAKDKADAEAAAAFAAAVAEIEAQRAAIAAADAAAASRAAAAQAAADAASPPEFVAETVG
jgi:hypothetical protein